MSGAQTWRRASETHTELLGAEAVVWSGEDRTLHHLDAPGTIVWLCLEEPGTSAEVLDRVAAVVGPTGGLAGDVLKFLAELADRSLLVTL